MTPVDDLSCAELVELVTGYLDDALSIEDRNRFEVHIASCGGCDVYLAQMRETIGALGRLTERDVEPDAARTLLEAFRSWKATS